MTLVLSLFVPISPSFGASGRLCFVIVAFPWYHHLYFYKLGLTQMLSDGWTENWTHLLYFCTCTGTTFRTASFLICVTGFNAHCYHHTLLPIFSETAAVCPSSLLCHVTRKGLNLCSITGNIFMQRENGNLAHPDYFENRIPLKPALGEGWGGGVQPRKLQCCIWRDSVKPSLLFSWFCVFFVSKGNPFFTFIGTYTGN